MTSVWFRDTAPDDPDIVHSEIVGYYYPCPDIESVDQHIRTLRGWIGPGSGLTLARRIAAHRDIDRLLDRRAWLAMCEEAA